MWFVAERNGDSAWHTLGCGGVVKESWGAKSSSVRSAVFAVRHIRHFCHFLHPLTVERHVWAIMPSVILSCCFMLRTQINHLTAGCSHASDSANFLQAHQVLNAQKTLAMWGFCSDITILFAYLSTCLAWVREYGLPYRLSSREGLQYAVSLWGCIWLIPLRWRRRLSCLLCDYYQIMTSVCVCEYVLALFIFWYA